MRRNSYTGSRQGERLTKGIRKTHFIVYLKACKEYHCNSQMFRCVRALNKAADSNKQNAQSIENPECMKTMARYIALRTLPGCMLKGSCIEAYTPSAPHALKA